MKDFGKALRLKAQQSPEAQLKAASEMLIAQASSLDAIFTEFARRSAMNIGEYLDASERYMRLALKAQAGSRAALEAVVRMHQPREQTVKHVHVNDGGQAVVADEFHQHIGGGAKWKIIQTIPCNRRGWRMRRAAWPELGKGRSASPQLWAGNGDVVCTEGQIGERLKAIGTFGNTVRGQHERLNVFVT